MIERDCETARLSFWNQLLQKTKSVHEEVIIQVIRTDEPMYSQLSFVTRDFHLSHPMLEKVVVGFRR